MTHWWHLLCSWSVKGFQQDRPPLVGGSSQIDLDLPGMNGQGGGHFQQLLSQTPQAPALAGFFLHQVAQAVHQLIGVKTQQQVNLITGQLPVVRLAQVACVSLGHFHQLFREATGKTPGQYLLQARLESARELLIQTQLPIEFVAHQVGFSSQSALTHAFKRTYQQTPGQVRRLH